MPQKFPVLDALRIAAPCGARWEEMEGDERARFCQECGKNVYNIAAMSRREAKSLVAEKEGRLCIRLMRRRDGTVITDNCPVGLRRMRRAALRWASGALALFFLMPGAGVLAGVCKKLTVGGAWPIVQAFVWKLDGRPDLPTPEGPMLGMLPHGPDQ